MKRYKNTGKSIKVLITKLLKLISRILQFNFI